MILTTTIIIITTTTDKEEVNDLLNQYDTDKSGSLDFKEFVIMMKGTIITIAILVLMTIITTTITKGWNDRFGTGWRKRINLLIKRG